MVATTKLGINLTTTPRVLPLCTHPYRAAVNVVSAVLCCAVLCCAVLCCAVLCCAVLCCVGCRWLLLRREAGGIEQRQKHVNVLMYGELDSSCCRTQHHVQEVEEERLQQTCAGCVGAVYR